MCIRDRDQVAAVVLRRRMPEMVEADSEQRADRGEAGDVPAQVAVALVGARHHHPVSYTHLRAHETVLDLVCRLLLEKKKTHKKKKKNDKKKKKQHK